VAQAGAELDRWVDWSWERVLRGEGPAGLMDRVDVVQPASFLMMLGLAAVWESMGVTPDAVVGHSQGEIAAACVAGALTMPDAVRIVAVRSQMIAAGLAGRGGMAAVGLPEDEVLARLRPWTGRVEVAAVNSPTSTVIAGDVQAVTEVIETWEEQGIRVRAVPVDYASHTRHVETLQTGLLDAFADVRAQAPRIPMYSTVTGDWIRDHDDLAGASWYQNLRGPVRFGPAVRTLIDTGHTVFVATRAHPVLVQPLHETADTTDTTTRSRIIISATLRRDDGGPHRLLQSAADLFVHGIPITWTTTQPTTPTSHHPDLPTYAFDHQHYWLKDAGPSDDATGMGIDGADADFW